MIKSKDFLCEQLNDLKNDLRDTIKTEIDNKSHIDFSGGNEFLSTNENLEIVGIYKDGDCYIVFQDESGQVIIEDLDETPESHETLYLILENLFDSNNKIYGVN